MIAAILLLFIVIAVIRVPELLIIGLPASVLIVAGMLPSVYDDSRYKLIVFGVVIVGCVGGLVLSVAQPEQYSLGFVSGVALISVLLFAIQQTRQAVVD